jgi:hypothetical protein
MDVGMQWIQARRAEGWTMSQIAEELGVPLGVLNRCRMHGETPDRIQNIVYKMRERQAQVPPKTKQRHITLGWIKSKAVRTVSALAIKAAIGTVITFLMAHVWQRLVGGK